MRTAVVLAVLVLGLGACDGGGDAFEGALTGDGGVDGAVDGVTVDTAPRQCPVSVANASLCQNNPALAYNCDDGRDPIESCQGVYRGAAVTCSRWLGYAYTNQELASFCSPGSVVPPEPICDVWPECVSAHGYGFDYGGETTDSPTCVGRRCAECFENNSFRRFAGCRVGNVHCGASRGPGVGVVDCGCAAPIPNSTTLTRYDCSTGAPPR